MKSRKKSVWTISGAVSAIAVAVFLIGIGAADRDSIDGDRTATGGRASLSDGAPPAEQSESSSSNQAGSAFDWPGLPAASISTDSDAVSSLQPEPEEDLAPELPLVELVEAFHDLQAHQRGEAAYRIASGWLRCRLHRVPDGADLWEVARQRYENSLRIAEAHLARSDDEARVAEEIRRIASIDRESAIGLIFEEIEALAQFCGGMGTLDLDEMEARAFEWIDRAAALGYPAARVDYVYRVFNSERVTPGKASLLVADKRRVVEYVHALLWARDVRGLELLGYIAQHGFFESPDPEHAHAYTKAALEIYSDAGRTVWRVPAGDDYNPVSMRWRLVQTEGKLDGAALSRAETLARRIVEMSR